jgi:hypothetical protein
MDDMSLRASLFLCAVAALSAGALAQVIQFESSGLKYQTLSKSGVTIMFAYLPAHLHEYQILQVGISNGSQGMCLVRPEDFVFERMDGTRVYATPARTVVNQMLERATRGDVIKLIDTYENSLNGVTRFRSTNGYEARRQNFLADSGSAKFRAAAAASAIALVETRLKTGESTDGAVFFYTTGKVLGQGRVMARVAGQIFEFDSEPQSTGKALQQREPDPARQ